MMCCKVSLSKETDIDDAYFNCSGSTTCMAVRLRPIVVYGGKLCRRVNKKLMRS